MRRVPVRCVPRQAFDLAAGPAEGMGLYCGAHMAPARIIMRFARWLTVIGLILFAGKALALDALDLVGEWKGSDNKIHRIKVHGFNRILLCRSVANVRGGIRAYRGAFAEGGFELVSKPQTIDDLNNKLPAALRRDLLRLGASYGAKIKIADKGRKLIVQFIGGTVTWSRSDPTKANSIKKILGDKVTLTHVITAKITVEIARRKAVRGVARLEYQNRGHAEVAYSSMRKHLQKLVDERWITPEERGLFEYHAKRIIGIGALDGPETQLLNLEPHYRWAKNYDSGPWIRRPSGRRQNALAVIQETMPKVRKQMNWLRGLLRAQIKLRVLREGLPDSTAAATGLRDVRAMSKFFRDAHYKHELITLDDYAAFVGLHSRLKPELDLIAKSKTVAKPTITPYRRPLTVPGC